MYSIEFRKIINKTIITNSYIIKGITLYIYNYTHFIMLIGKVTIAITVIVVATRQPQSLQPLKIRINSPL